VQVGESVDGDWIGNGKDGSGTKESSNGDVKNVGKRVPWKK
jgi:hypothetical protein